MSDERIERIKELTRSDRKNGPCELCGRKNQSLTFHHLIPKMVHKRKRFQKQFSRQEMKSRGLYICKLCHNGIHDLFEEKDLALNYSTKELLMANPVFQKHVAWASKQK